MPYAITEKRMQQLKLMFRNNENIKFFIGKFKIFINLHFFLNFLRLKKQDLIYVYLYDFCIRFFTNFLFKYLLNKILNNLETYV